MTFAAQDILGHLSDDYYKKENEEILEYLETLKERSGIDEKPALIAMHEERLYAPGSRAGYFTLENGLTVSIAQAFKKDRKTGEIKPQNSAFGLPTEEHPEGFFDVRMHVDVDVVIPDDMDLTRLDAVKEDNGSGRARIMSRHFQQAADSEALIVRAKAEAIHGNQIEFKPDEADYFTGEGKTIEQIVDMVNHASTFSAQALQEAARNEFQMECLSVRKSKAFHAECATQRTPTGHD